MTYSYTTLWDVTVFGADVPLGSGEGFTITRTNGLPSLTISVLKEPDGNTVEVSNAVTARLKGLEDGLPSDVQFVEISNQAPGIQKSINELTQEVLLGAVLAVMVIFTFLLSVRPTLVTSISIPASVLAAFIVMAWQGMSLNLLTLGGLAIAVGRVVDDSIVVMENIFRHIQLGDDRWTAALNGTREVTVPIVTSTMTTIAVFAPLGIIGGHWRDFRALCPDRHLRAAGVAAGGADGGASPGKPADKAR